MTGSDVTRIGSLLDLPDESVRCLAMGHQWSDPPITDAPGWGMAAWELRLTCPCGRWRKDVVSADTMELIYRDYGGGVLLALGATVDRLEARAEWFRRKRAAALGVESLAKKRQRKAAAT